MKNKNLYNLVLTIFREKNQFLSGSFVFLKEKIIVKSKLKPLMEEPKNLEIESKKLDKNLKEIKNAISDIININLKRLEEIGKEVKKIKKDLDSGKIPKEFENSAKKIVQLFEIIISLLLLLIISISRFFARDSHNSFNLGTFSFSSTKSIIT